MWDATPNIDQERGLTIPRLMGLLEAAGVRKKRELKEVGQTMALAFHEPKKLERVSGDEPDVQQEGEKWGTGWDDTHWWDNAPEAD